MNANFSFKTIKIEMFKRTRFSTHNFSFTFITVYFIETILSFPMSKQCKCSLFITNDRSCFLHYLVGKSKLSREKKNTIRIVILNQQKAYELSDP